MNKAILAGLALMLVRDCELVGSRPAGGTIKGTWGGDNAGLIADDSSAHVHIRCTFGNVHQAIVLDAAGRFDVPGDYVLRAYPVYVGPTLPARFQGSVSGKTMALSVTVLPGRAASDRAASALSSADPGRNAPAATRIDG